MNFIDAHHHLWDLQHCHYPWLMAQGVTRFFGDPTPIQHNYVSTNFAQESKKYSPLASVHIQVGTSEKDSMKETAWLETQSPFPSASVAFCQLEDSAQRSSLLEQHMNHSKFRGIRQIIGRHPTLESNQLGHKLLTSVHWITGLIELKQHNLSFDLQMIPAQMNPLLSAIDAAEGLKVNLCHAGSPWDQSATGIKSWERGIRALAERPNTFAKVSGLGMFKPKWKSGDWHNIAHRLIDAFGPDRIMFGSNFPVDKLYASYDQVWDEMMAICSQYNANEQAAMLVNNAASFYRLNI